MVQVAARWMKSYVFAQVVTGLEIGVLAALGVVMLGVSLPVALAAVIPFGLPLVSAQMAAFGLWLDRTTLTPKEQLA